MRDVEAKYNFYPRRSSTSAFFSAANAAASADGEDFGAIVLLARGLIATWSRLNSNGSGSVQNLPHTHKHKHIHKHRHTQIHTQEHRDTDATRDTEADTYTYTDTATDTDTHADTQTDT